MNITINKYLIFIMVIVAIVLLMYLGMFFSTNHLIEYVENVMLGNVLVEDTAGTPLERYNNRDIYENAQVQVSIIRLFTIHDFSNGYIWVKYTYETQKNDMGILVSTADVISRWKIKRENGVWKIVEIKENP